MHIMLKFKTMVTAVAVIGGLTMALASNGMKKADPTTQKWFLYDPQPGQENVNDPANYTLTASGGTTVPTCDASNGTRCAIEAQPDQTNPSQPDMSQISIIRLKDQ